MFKRVFGWIAGVALLGIVSGCGSGGDDNAGGSGPNSGDKYLVGISVPAADHGWTAGVKWWAEQASKNYPDIEWIIEDAKSPDEQITDLENMMSQGVDAVVILAVDSAPITPIAKQLRRWHSHHKRRPWIY